MVVADATTSGGCVESDVSLRAGFECEMSLCLNYYLPPGHLTILYKLIPPVTSIFCPLIHLASSVHKKATTLPISSACPTRPSGVWLAKKPFICGLFLMAALLKSVSIGPGATTLHRIPLDPYSFATYLVKISIAPFMEE